MARKKIESKSKTTTRTRKKTPVEILHPKKGEPDVKEIKHILQLPDDEDGDEKLKKMLAAFDDSFTRSVRRHRRHRLSPSAYLRARSKT